MSDDSCPRWGEVGVRVPSDRSPTFCTKLSTLGKEWIIHTRQIKPRQDTRNKKQQDQTRQDIKSPVKPWPDQHSSTNQHNTSQHNTKHNTTVTTISVPTTVLRRAVNPMRCSLQFRIIMAITIRRNRIKIPQNLSKFCCIDYMHHNNNKIYTNSV